MVMPKRKLNPLLPAALLLALALPAVAQEAAAPAVSQKERIARLLEELRDPDEPEWQRVEADLDREWSKSGSAAMDVLLERGKDAMEQGHEEEAIGHLTALTDHAPDFAQGWNVLASAYYRAGMFGPSVEAIGRALALNPNQYESLAGLGLILEDTGHEKEALAAFRAAQAIHPHMPTINEAIERLDHKTGGRSL